jgi:signal transduction histidine kinase/CheY-like chemotaxis protein
MQSRTSTNDGGTSKPPRGVTLDPTGMRGDTRLVYAAIALVTGCVLVADLFTSLGIAIWVFYFLPVAFSLWVWRPSVPVVVAFVCTVLIGITYFTDDPGSDRRLALLNRSFGLAIIWITALIGSLFVRNKLAVERQKWVQSGQNALSDAMAGDKRIEDLGETVLRFLAEYVNASAGVFFAREGGAFQRVATYGVPPGGAPDAFDTQDGLLGQSVKDGRPFVLQDLPDGYITVGSALGRATPKHVLVAPLRAERSVNAVVELGFLDPVEESAIELLERLGESISVAVRSSQYRAHLQKLLAETQRQTEELQVQGEELRVSNEELEEQGRALKESQVKLEEQQADLEQANAHLEEQTQHLAAQRDELARVNASVQRQALALERASQYKSDFLANMSHELRTPLNSTLILAKLLADNPGGNLTAEQVKFAQTIQSAGNDLLALISDILDLSKIEAGRMELEPADLDLDGLLESLRRTFEPLAAQKDLDLRTHVLPGCPKTVETDRQRIEQVLKNLLSNAIKFTDRGRVELTVRPAPRERIAFAVTDTGVGIPEDQQEAVFEAFRQADGTTSRRYGGTGLGLSISRELARLLGGEITLSSKPGEGSTFTLTLPAAFARSRAEPRPTDLIRGATPEPAAAPAAHASTSIPIRPRPAASAAATSRPEDDRERLNGNGRVILVVEDDEPFARILADLAHELDFRCLIAPTAEEGVRLAGEHLPSAVVLDVGLPDHSGLSVLDRLKHDPRTRHIPVHVVSGHDHAKTAMSLGAVGYMRKPVDRDQMLAALKGLEDRLSQRVKRVLVVEDDPVQLDSLQRLLGSHDVQTVGARTAAECLNLLQDSTFDCMVLDLSLPDASGYSMLETLSRDDAYSFPPVIVYTGRDLSADEEQRLRRYSSSIIIKGAKSPERLLDEVTLFLHQVVSELPAEQQRMLEQARSRDAALEGRRILVVEDDVRNVFALSSILEPRGALLEIARNGREALAALERTEAEPDKAIDLVLMDVMMPEMDGLTATREIRSRPGWAKLPIIMLTAKAMQQDQEKALAAGANDYMAKPLDVEKLLSLVRVWMPR